MLHVRLGCVLGVAVLVAGCGGKSASPPSATATAAAAVTTPTPAKTASPGPALTSADDLAACSQLERTIDAVSVLVGHTTEGITQATNPKELAKLTGTAQQSLLDSARVIEIVDPPKPLLSSERSFVKGLRMFAADFARGRASASKGDMAKATEQLTDETALRKIQVSAKRIDDLCGA